MSIAPWSFSKIKSFEQCPKKFYHLKVAKDYAEKETDAMYYGTAFHLAAEEYVRDGTPLPEKFIYGKPVLDSLISKKGEKLCELKMGLTADLEPCGFFDEDVWWRGIADLVILDRENKLAWAIDYKTSKNTRYADKGQLELMALGVFAKYPQIKTVRAGLFFVVCNDLVKDTYMEYDSGKLWEKWLGKYAQMQTAADEDMWNARPNGLCRRHCPVIECVHNGAN